MLSQRTTNGPGAAVPTPAVSASPTNTSDRDETHRHDYTYDGTQVPPAALEHAVARLGEAELTVEVVRVAGVEVPLRPGERPFVDRETDELDAEAASTMLLEHVDVSEVRLHLPVRERPGEADLLVAVVKADDACRAVDEIVLDLYTRPPFGPVQTTSDRRAPHRDRSAPDRRRARSRRRGRASYGERAQAEAAVKLV